MNNSKKMAAALSGVLAYIKTQEEVLWMQSAASTQVGQIPSEAAIPSIPTKMWGISGRQSQMQMRHHMLLKAFHRSV
jgi:hypothetical protein